MNILTLFVSPSGRISRGAFWLGLIGAWVLAMLASLLPRPFNAVGLLLFWPEFCVFTKRLHDKGHSAWRLWIPITLNIVLGLVTAFTGVLAFAYAFSNSSYERHLHPVTPPPFWLAALLGILAIMIYNMIYVLWLGVTPGQPAANRFGSPPGANSAVPSPS